MVSGEEQIDMVQIFLSHPQKHPVRMSCAELTQELSSCPFKGNDKRMQHSDRKSFPENSREFLKKKVRFVNRTNKGIRKEDKLRVSTREQ